MADVIHIHQKRLFSLDEALEVLPVIRRITERAVNAYRKTCVRIEDVGVTPEECLEVEEKLHGHISEWMIAVRKLGCEVKGLWIVDFDRGDGFYCWKYPEETISYFHKYEEGFASRVPVGMLDNAPSDA
jgi:hypothetical protein